MILLVVLLVSLQSHRFHGIFVCEIALNGDVSSIDYEMLALECSHTSRCMSVSSNTN